MKTWIAKKYVAAQQYFVREPEANVKRCDALAWILLFFGARRVFGLPVRWVIFPTLLLALASKLVLSIPTDSLTFILAVSRLVLWFAIFVILSCFALLNGFFFMYEWQTRLKDDDLRESNNLRAMRRAWNVLPLSMRIEAVYYTAGLITVLLGFAASAFGAIKWVFGAQRNITLTLVAQTLGTMILITVALSLVWYGTKFAKRLSSLVKQNSTICPVIKIESE